MHFPYRTLLLRVQVIPAFPDIIAISGGDKIWSRSLASANLTDSLMMVERLGPWKRAK